MRILFLVRGQNELRIPVTNRLEKLLNTDVNNVRAHVLRFSDHDRDGTNSPKAIFNNLKKALRNTLSSNNLHVVIDSEAPSQQSWAGFAKVLEDYPSTFVVGIDVEDAKMYCKSPAGSVMYQNVTENDVEKILENHYITPIQ